ncbi:hypothetical protein PtB15_18B426 [Puccinia triticina]|nr:hypothetical protein PtB15_18B426 [Puccinia triticina]
MEQILQDLQVENLETDVLNERQQWLQNICSQFNCTRPVLQSVLDNLAKKNFRLWLSWNSQSLELLKWSKSYLDVSEEAEASLEYQWDLIVMQSKAMWETLVSGNSVMMEYESGEDQLEEDMLAQEQNDFYEQDNL